MADQEKELSPGEKAGLELDGFVDDAEAAANIDLTDALRDRDAQADQTAELDEQEQNGDASDAVSDADGDRGEPDPDTPLSLSLDKKEPESDGPPSEELAADLVANDGKFSEKMVAKLKKDGWSQRHINAEQKAMVLEIRQQVAELQQLAGGAKSWKDIQTWAQQNLKPGQMEVFNKQLSDSDPDTRKTAVELLKTRYEVSTGQRVSTQIDGRPAPKGSQNPIPKIEDHDQYHKLISDTRYNGYTPEAQRYTRYVEERLAEWAAENV